MPQTKDRSKSTLVIYTIHRTGNQYLNRLLCANESDAKIRWSHASKKSSGKYQT